MAFYHDLKKYIGDPLYPNKQDWIASRLLTLRHDLYESIKKDRKPNSLIIGSWNIRAFDDGIPRMDESYHYIAEIIDHFDICAIQEIKSNLEPLERLVKLLGPNWDYLVSDVSTHEGGNNERMSFVYNKNKVVFKNLIGEIVLSKEDLINGNQVARSPFFASFQSAWFKFSMCSAHILYGNDLSVRAKEINSITKALIKRAQKEDQIHIFLGDMNIKSPDDIIMQALKGSGLVVPEFGPTNMNGTKWYDQIAFTDKGKATRKTKLIRHGKFDWRHAVFGPHPKEEKEQFSKKQIKKGLERIDIDTYIQHYEGKAQYVRKQAKKKPYKDFSKSYKKWTTWEMSDHLPIWIELEVDYSDDYLRRYL